MTKQPNQPPKLLIDGNKLIEFIDNHTNWHLQISNDLKGKIKELVEPDLIGQGEEYSLYEIHTAINMARGITFQGDKHNYHNTNTEIVEYLKNIKVNHQQPSITQTDEKV